MNYKSEISSQTIISPRQTTTILLKKCYWHHFTGSITINLFNTFPTKLFHMFKKLFFSPEEVTGQGEPS